GARGGSGSRRVDTLAVGVGGPGARTGDVLDVLRAHGPAELVTVPAGASRSTVDEVLSTVDDGRLVVIADLAGLSMVVLQLLRRSLLGSVTVGAVVDSPQW